MNIIKGFENENIECSEFTEKIGNDVVDYKFEYFNNQKIIENQTKEIEELKIKLENTISEDRIKNYIKVIEEKLSELKIKINGETYFCNMTLSKENQKLADSLIVQRETLQELLENKGE